MFSRKLNKIVTGAFSVVIGLGIITAPIQAQALSDLNSINNSVSSTESSEEEQTSSAVSSARPEENYDVQEDSSSNMSSVSAAEGASAPSVTLPESVADATKGIVQVNSVYTNDTGKESIILGCTGFLIGNTEDGE